MHRVAAKSTHIHTSEFINQYLSSNLDAYLQMGKIMELKPR